MAMKTSDQGRQFISQAGVEDRVSTVYKDSNGKPTIGVGHLLTPSERMSGKILIAGVPVRYELGLSNAQIDQLLRQDLAKAEAAVNEGITVPLTQVQFDTLVVFVFNVGRSAFLESGKGGGVCGVARAINEGRLQDVPGELRRWIYDDGLVSKGLINRRNHEINLWERGQYVV